MSAKQNDPSFLVLSTHRVIFVHLDQPHKFEDQDTQDSEPKFDCTWLIPYNHPDAVAIMQSMQGMHAAEALSKFKGMPFDLIYQGHIWNPLRNGDQYADLQIAKGGKEEVYNIYRGHYFIKATSAADKPPVVFQQLEGQGRVEVIDIKREVYSGCYARAVLKGVAWNNKGKYGFSYFINSVLKTAEGPRIGGFSANVEDYDFGADVTDRSTLLAGEAPSTAGFAMPGQLPAPGGFAPPRATTPGTLPQMPGMVPQQAAFTPPPAAQRPPLPGMVPQQAAFTPPPVQAPKPMAPQPIYAEWEGKATVSFDNGANWEYVV